MQRPWHGLTRLFIGRAGVCDDALREAVADRTILITGASGSVGGATVRRLVRAGATIIATARSACLLDDAITQRGTVFTYAADLSWPESIEALAEHVLLRHGSVDILVNAASRRPHPRLTNPLHKADDLRAVINVNVVGPIRLLSALAPAMRTRVDPRVVNVSHVGVRLPLTRQCSDFYSAKAAFGNWLQGPDTGGIDVTTVYLGPLSVSPEDAAGLVCDAIVSRSDEIAPWFGRSSGSMSRGRK